MSQTRRESFVEAATNTTIAAYVALAGQLLIYPLYDIDITIWSNIQLTTIFTVLSVLRNYLVRRFFNKRQAHAPTHV